MTKMLAPFSVTVALFLSGCAAYPPWDATHWSDSTAGAADLRYLKMSGKEVAIFITLPHGVYSDASLNAVFQYHDVYFQSYANSYKDEWNKQVAARIRHLRDYEGRFASVMTEQNYHLYDGEFYALSQDTWRNLCVVPADNKLPDSDARTSALFGRIDGRLVARKDFAAQLLSREQQSDR